MWRDFVEASKTADFESKRLSLHARGDALAFLVHGLKINHGGNREFLTPRIQRSEWDPSS